MNSTYKQKLVDIVNQYAKKHNLKLEGLSKTYVNTRINYVITQHEYEKATLDNIEEIQLYVLRTIPSNEEFFLTIFKYFQFNDMEVLYEFLAHKEKQCYLPNNLEDIVFLIKNSNEHLFQKEDISIDKHKLYFLLEKILPTNFLEEIKNLFVDVLKRQEKDFPRIEEEETYTFHVENTFFYKNYESDPNGNFKLIWLKDIEKAAKQYLNLTMQINPILYDQDGNILKSEHKTTFIFFGSEKNKYKAFLNYLIDYYHEFSPENAEAFLNKFKLDYELPKYENKNTSNRIKI